MSYSLLFIQKFLIIFLNALEMADSFAIIEQYQQFRFAEKEFFVCFHI